MANQTPEYLKTHTLAADKLSFALDIESNKLAEELSQNSSHNGRRGVALVKQDNLAVVLTALSAGNRIVDHDVHGRTTVQLLRGDATITFGDEVVHGKAGTLVSIGSGVTHAIDALQDSVVLTTVSLAP